VPPRRKRRNRTSLWPSKMGTRLGDVIKDARLENLERCSVGESQVFGCVVEQTYRQDGLLHEHRSFYGFHSGVSGNGELALARLNLE
jgi:hypothetical protein